MRDIEGSNLHWSSFTAVNTSDVNELLECDEGKKIHLCFTEASKSRWVSPKILSKLWDIPHQMAFQAIERNTQLARHNDDNILSRILHK